MVVRGTIEAKRYWMCNTEHQSKAKIEIENMAAGTIGTGGICHSGKRP